jgi:hypothetical protein
MPAAARPISVATSSPTSTRPITPSTIKRIAHAGLAQQSRDELGERPGGRGPTQNGQQRRADPPVSTATATPTVSRAGASPSTHSGTAYALDMTAAATPASARCRRLSLARAAPSNSPLTCAANASRSAHAARSRPTGDHAGKRAAHAPQRGGRRSHLVGLARTQPAILRPLRTGIRAAHPRRLSGHRPAFLTTIWPYPWPTKTGSDLAAFAALFRNELKRFAAL